MFMLAYRRRHRRLRRQSSLAMAGVDKAPFYDLMWGDIGARAIGADSFDREASGFLQLLRAVEAYLHAEGLSDCDTLDVSIKLWSMVHGLSAITMSGKLAYFHPDANMPAMITESAHTFMQGLKAQRYKAQRTDTEAKALGVCHYREI